MKFYDREQLENLNKYSVYGFRVVPNGYGKIHSYCAKIFRDNNCELVNLYVNTDIMAFIFKKNGAYHSSNCSIKYYNDLLDSANKSDYNSSAGIKLKVIAQMAYTWEVKL